MVLALSRMVRSIWENGVVVLAGVGVRRVSKRRMRRRERGRGDLVGIVVVMDGSKMGG